VPPRPPILEADHELIRTRTEALREEARGGRFFVTGGTGFFGCWILESLIAANDDYGLGLSLTVLTRNVDAFRARAPHLATHPAVHLLGGDVRSFPISGERFEYVIHAAFDSSREPDAVETRSTIVDGTARCLELACRARARRFLFVSSGAVYGKQPPDLSRVPEEYADDPASSNSISPYGEAKRAAEALCLRTASETGLEVKIARGFAFVGPHMPLDAHFAIGNFIRDALAGAPIRVRGDGTAIRSYLYGADLAVWLLTILLRGRSGAAYNVGSEREVSVGELARLVADTIDPCLAVEVARPASEGPPERYVPSSRKACVELGLAETVELREAIRRTATWFRNLPGDAVR
jgi:nucleoside-diphosphate-sugar epimerase